LAAGVERLLSGVSLGFLSSLVVSSLCKFPLAVSARHDPVIALFRDNEGDFQFEVAALTTDMLLKEPHY
jgi:hypothetical protein